MCVYICIYLHRWPSQGIETPDSHPKSTHSEMTYESPSPGAHTRRCNPNVLRRRGPTWGTSGSMQGAPPTPADPIPELQSQRPNLRSQVYRSEQDQLKRNFYTQMYTPLDSLVRVTLMYSQMQSV